MKLIELQTRVVDGNAVIVVPCPDKVIEGEKITGHIGIEWDLSVKEKSGKVVKLHGVRAWLERD